MEKNEPIVVATYKKDKTIKPVVVEKKTEHNDDVVVLKFDEDNKKKNGITVEIEEKAQYTIALKNMAPQIENYMLSYGYKAKHESIVELVSAMTTRLIYTPKESFDEGALKAIEFFGGKIYKAESEEDVEITKLCYSACRFPNQIHVLCITLKDRYSIPEFLVEYIKKPNSKISFEVNEYINDIFIPRMRLWDNIFLYVVGDIRLLPESLEHYYAIWNPQIEPCDRILSVYQMYSMNSLKNMHKVMDPISDSLWDKVSAIEHVLSLNNVRLSNKDSNHIDDYLVTMSNQGMDEKKCIQALVEYRVLPMFKQELDEKHLIEMLIASGIELEKEI